MISTFHPSLILCTHEKWIDESYRDKFLSNLLLHISKIKELSINIAWCDEITPFLWNDPPWKNSCVEPILIEIYYEIINHSCRFDPPPENECNIVPQLKNEIFTDLNTSWSILIHRIVHTRKEVFVVIGLDKENEIDSIHVSCECEPKNLEDDYQLIDEPAKWNMKIDYMALCPRDLNRWDIDFPLTLKLCYEQEFNQRILKNKIENLEFSTNFKRAFMDTNDRTKKKIISAIVQRLTYTRAEAGGSSGLRDEQIQGKRNEYSFRVSGVERIHYKLSEYGKFLLLNYYPGSKHDTRCK